MKVLVLEDNKERLEWFSDTFSKCELYIAMTAEKAADAIMKWEFDLIFIDHDLGKVRDGYDFAKILAKEIDEGRIVNDPSIYIHSLNPVGTKRITSVLKDAIICPFSDLIKKSENSYN